MILSIIFSSCISLIILLCVSMSLTISISLKPYEQLCELLAYHKNQDWIVTRFFPYMRNRRRPLNCLKLSYEAFQNIPIFVEEALHRLVEIYYKIGLVEEAKVAAALLGYNYNSGEWYEKSYKILNTNYKSPIIKKDNEKDSLIRRTIKKILFIDEKSGKN